MNSGFPAARVQLDKLHVGPIEWAGELTGEVGAWGLEDVDLLSLPRLEYRAEAAGSGGIRVQGVVRAHAGLTCRRCLRGIEQTIEIGFDFRFDPAVARWDEEERVYGLDPEAAFLDLSGPLREELILALPEYPECPQGCGGLCPMCGADLDKSDCGCSSEERDPRWDVLRELVPDGQPSAAEPDSDKDGP